MKNSIKTILRGLSLSLISMLLFCATTHAQNQNNNYQQVEIQTNLGNIIIQLDREKAPQSVANFKRYVNDQRYNNTIFHRVIKDFMIQGGGFNSAFKESPAYEPVANEADNGLKNTYGSIAMARTRDPHSATQQFFINTADNNFLNHRNKSLSGWGYTVFGKVISGLEIVKKMNIVKTGRGGHFSADVPVNTIIIYRIIPYTIDTKTEKTTK